MSHRSFFFPQYSLVLLSFVTACYTLPSLAADAPASKSAIQASSESDDPFAEEASTAANETNERRSVPSQPVQEEPPLEIRSAEEMLLLVASVGTGSPSAGAQSVPIHSNIALYGTAQRSRTSGVAYFQTDWYAFDLDREGAIALAPHAQQTDAPLLIVCDLLWSSPSVASQNVRTASGNYLAGDQVPGRFVLRNVRVPTIGDANADASAAASETVATTVLPQRPAAKSDAIDELDGIWAFTSIGMNGQTLRIRNDELHVTFISGRVRVFDSRTGQGKFEFQYTLDSQSTPKAIDLRNPPRRKPVHKLGVYELSDDELIISLAEDGNDERPIDFANEDGRLIWKLRRLTQHTTDASTSRNSARQQRRVP